MPFHAGVDREACGATVDPGMEQSQSRNGTQSIIPVYVQPPDKTARRLEINSGSPLSFLPYSFRKILFSKDGS
jgi:hypothetical protein